MPNQPHSSWLVRCFRGSRESVRAAQSAARAALASLDLEYDSALPPAAGPAEPPAVVEATANLRRRLEALAAALPVPPRPAPEEPHCA